jgi:transposase-like protein
MHQRLVKVHGQWRDLYRAIHCAGVLLNVMLSQRRAFSLPRRSSVPKER